MGKLPGEHIPKHVCFPICIIGSIPAALVAHGTNRPCFFIGNKRNGGKAQCETGSKKEPFIDKYLSHPGWFIGFDEDKRRDVTGMVKNILDAWFLSLPERI